MSTNALLAFFQPQNFDVIEIAQFFVALYLSLSFHEAAHAWMAYRHGDDTAYLMGRMTLNPIVHIDPIGTVFVPLLMVINLGIPLIGWAKPVPVNPLRFRDMRKGEIQVSLAGPVSNFILASGALVASWMVLALALMFLKPGEPMHVVTMLLLFLRRLMILNLVLGLFNLIPISPLDGSHILRVLLPREAAEKYDRLLVPPFNYLVLFFFFFVVLPMVGDMFGLISALVDYLCMIWWL